MIKCAGAAVEDRRVLSNPGDTTRLESWAAELERRSVLLLRIAWEPGLCQDHQMVSHVDVVRSESLIRQVMPPERNDVMRAEN
jgi:hypothetical protein